MLMLIPVAKGRTIQSFTSVMPQVWIKSTAIFRVSSQIREEPAALGYWSNAFVSYLNGSDIPRSSNSMGQIEMTLCNLGDYR